MSQYTIPPSRGKDGKKLGGGAAQLHFIKQLGGFDSFVENIATRAAKNTLLELEKESKKQSFKLVN